MILKKIKRRDFLKTTAVGSAGFALGMNPFQINLNTENESVHKIRKDMRLFNASITEGWGNYAAFLAEEIGMLDKPLDQYGWLVFQMFFYNRLVLDTGMNALGWSLEEAREFMRKYTFATETEIQTETLRYLSLIHI